FGNLAEMTKPGGLLLMIEANADFFFEPVRQLWYENDAHFDWQTERALYPAEVTQLAQDWFELDRFFFFGGPAYYIIYNSQILRVPLGLKKWLTGGLFAVERVWNALPVRRLFPAFGAVWRRKETDVQAKSRKLNDTSS